MKFRKKPIVIDAEQFLATKKSFDAVLAMGGLDWEPGTMGTESFIVKTLEGQRIASRGDWIIKGVNGEFYPCKPDIFEKTYEPVE